MRTTIEHYFPTLFDQLRALDDVRHTGKASDYELAAHLTACLALFLFKLDSRNHWNQKRKKWQFQRNYKKLFGFAMPHGDSMHAVIRLLDERQVEQLCLGVEAVVEEDLGAGALAEALAVRRAVLRIEGCRTERHLLTGDHRFTTAFIGQFHGDLRHIQGLREVHRGGFAGFSGRDFDAVQQFRIRSRHARRGRAGRAGRCRVAATAAGGQ